MERSRYIVAAIADCHFVKVAAESARRSTGRSVARRRNAKSAPIQARIVGDVCQLSVRDIAITTAQKICSEEIKIEKRQLSEFVRV